MHKELLIALVTGCFSVLGSLGGVLITLIFQAKAEKENTKWKE